MTGSPEALPDFEDSLRMVAKYADSLGPDQCSMTVDDDGSLVSTGTEDPTFMVQYPTYNGPLGPENQEVLRRSRLTEVDRLSGQVDLVSCSTTSGKDELYAFKYTIVDQKLNFI